MRNRVVTVITITVIIFALGMFSGISCMPDSASGNPTDHPLPAPSDPHGP